MAVTPNIASTVVAGVINKKVAINPIKSVNGITSKFAGFDPTYTAGDRQKVNPADHFAARNASGMKVFTNEAKRPGTDNVDEKFYAHIA